MYSITILFCSPPVKHSLVEIQVLQAIPPPDKQFSRRSPGFKWENRVSTGANVLERVLNGKTRAIFSANFQNLALQKDTKYLKGYQMGKRRAVFLFPRILQKGAVEPVYTTVKLKRNEC